MRAGLPKGVSYRQLKHVRLVGILLVVYVRESMAERVTDVTTGMVSTGIMGMLGEFSEFRPSVCLSRPGLFSF